MNDATDEKTESTLSPNLDTATRARYLDAFKAVASAETAYFKDFYAQEGAQLPLVGHCVVVARFLQDRHGGSLVFGYVGSRGPGGDSTEKLSHWWNLLPDGTEVDALGETLFGTPWTPDPSAFRRCVVKKLDSVPQQYHKNRLFRKRVEEYLNG